MVFADNADKQINLVVHRQNSSDLVCRVPLFKPNASWTDNSPIKYFDGENYHVVIQNLFNDTKFLTPDQPINGLNNSFTGMPGGLSKYTITPLGNCSLTWTNDEDISKMTTAPTLSTKTGLIYGYSQDGKLAANGEYIWYATAIDFKTGKTVWKVRTGAGGNFNNNFRTTFLAPDGSLVQPVQGGVIVIRDGDTVV